MREAGRTGHKIPSVTHSVGSMGHLLIIKLFDSFAHSKTTQLHTKLGFFAATYFKRTGVKHAVGGISSFERMNFITRGGVKLLRVFDAYSRIVDCRCRCLSLPCHVDQHTLGRVRICCFN